LSVKILALARLAQSGAAVSMIGSVQNQAGGTKQGIHSPFERANHGPDAAPLDQPAARAGFPLSAGLAHHAIELDGQRSVTQLPSVPNSTGPILGGTGQGARMLRFCARSQRGATTYNRRGPG
jgi:hypothetical protein